VIKRAPSFGRIAAMVLFALSCFGVLTFLWLSFGGTVPLKPKGYRFEVAFPRAGQLAQNADVRIAGITVGHVAKIGVDPRGNHALVTIEVDRKFAPIHRDAQAVLRSKTIGGETYVEITSGSRGAPALPDGARLPPGQVVNTVQLEDLLNAFDPQDAQGVLGLAAGPRRRDQRPRREPQQRARRVPAAGGERERGAGGARHPAERGAAARAQRRHRVPRAQPQPSGAARADRELRAGVPGHLRRAQRAGGQLRDLPTFLDQTRVTQARLESFSTDTDPLVQDLRR